VGGSGTFAQTFDNATWTARSIAPQDLYAVTCVGNRDGWAAGAAGLVAHTTDGGQTWGLQDAHTQVSLRAVRFASVTLGVVAGDAGTVAVTRDGGATWTVMPVATHAALRGAAVAPAAGVMFLVGDGGALLRSTDGGATWNVGAIGAASDLRSVAADPGAHLVIAVDAAGAVWSSVDAGISFHQEASGAAPLEAVALADDGSVAVAVGARGLVLQRQADATWRVAPARTAADLHAAVITGNAADQIYVGGDSGVLLGSADRGATWAQTPLGTVAPLYALDDL
jgi:photosystem II stability/assembly factor-like uncharacterized protein